MNAATARDRQQGANRRPHNQGECAGEPSVLVIGQKCLGCGGARSFVKVAIITEVPNAPTKLLGFVDPGAKCQDVARQNAMRAYPNAQIKFVAAKYHVNQDGQPMQRVWGRT